jgi:hypothetical protein
MVVPDISSASMSSRPSALTLVIASPASRTPPVQLRGTVQWPIQELEVEDALLGRMDEAAKYIDPDFLAVSPHCGYATHAEGGNNLRLNQQQRKL